MYLTSHTVHCSLYTVLEQCFLKYNVFLQQHQKTRLMLVFCKQVWLCLLLPLFQVIKLKVIYHRNQYMTKRDIVRSEKACASKRGASASQEGRGLIHLYTVTCTLSTLAYPVSCTLSPVNCQLYTVTCTVYTVTCKLSTLHYHQYTVTCTLSHFPIFFNFFFQPLSF